MEKDSKQSPVVRVFKAMIPVALGVAAGMLLYQEASKLLAKSEEV
tara:strand:- start:2746 stop:2880 length:135 start_codon:yes stop_codon:yes gene_type:complete